MSEEVKRTDAGTEAGATQKPEAGATQKPEAGATQKPEAGATQKPEAGATQEPAAGAAAADKPAAAKPPAKPGAASPELSGGGKALAEAIAELGLNLGEARPDSLGNPILEVPPDRLQEVGAALKVKLGLSYMSCLAPLDWPDRWEVVYHLFDFERKTWLALKTRIPKDQLSVPSVSGIWPAANWYEREGYDMYGVEFAGHPHLCRILMADDWETFPLRKDHPMDVEGGY